MRDIQESKVYKWEEKWRDWNRETASLKELRELIHWACKKYGLKPPAVKQHQGTAYSYSLGNVISFRRDQKNPAIALHETAHFICDKIFTEENLEDHSPEWLGIYMWLLEGARVAPRLALHSTAGAHRLRWVATWIVSPFRLGARMRARQRNRRRAKAVDDA